MRSILTGICGVCVGVWLLCVPGIAGPAIHVQCEQCFQDNGVVSLAVGQPALFQVIDSEKPIREVIWLFGDGTKAYGFGVTHAYKVPGRFTLEALVVYDGEIPQSVTVTVHAVIAPSLSNGGRTIWGLPTDIVYPILSALAVVIVYWLTGTMPGG